MKTSSFIVYYASSSVKVTVIISKLYSATSNIFIVLTGIEIDVCKLTFLGSAF